jgi:hypothetical protein
LLLKKGKVSGEMGEKCDVTDNMKAAQRHIGHEILDAGNQANR